MASGATNGSTAIVGAIHPRRLADTLAWIGRRLRNRPDREHEMTINRLALSGLGLIYVALATAFGDASAAGIFDKAGLLISVYWTCSFALFGHLLYQPGVSLTRRLIAMPIDFGFLSYCMHVGGEAMAPIYPIYLWVIFGNGFRFGVLYLAVASACGVVSFTAVVLTTEFWHGHPLLSAGLIGGLILLPIYVSSLIRKLSDAKRQAEEASKAKSLFLASVSHELRTPLNAIIGLSDLMRETRLDAEQKDMTQTIGQSGRLLLNLINQILDFSRIEAGRMQPRAETFDLYALLGNVRRLLQVQVQAKGLRIALHVTPRTPQDLVGDSGQLEEILVNLASNAVKFTVEGHVVIAVDALAQPDGRLRLRVEVTDTGIGIAEEAQKRIFESFTQADETIIDRFGGTGLGLAIVKQLVEMHGGEIGVVSAPGEGSTFWFEIDIEAYEAGAEIPTQTSQPVVLLAPDAATRETLRASLPHLTIAETESEAASLIKAAREHGVRHPVAILDPPADAVAAAALARRVNGSNQAPAALIAIVDAGRAGMLPEPMREWFVTTLARPVDDAGIAAAIAIATESHHGTEESNVTVLSKGISRKQLSILVAEDNRTNQIVIGKILEKAGHAFTIVDDGEAALEALHECTYDLVLMDINMPVMNGIEATKLYRFQALGEKHVPIVALTGDATAEVAERCERAGMDGYLTKPIEPARLVEAIERLVHAKQNDESITGDIGEAATDSPDVMPVASPAIELHKLDELRRLGGVEFVDDLVQQFLDDSIVVLQELAAAVHRGDVNSFREQAHALRSGAANVGARGIYEMCLAWRQIDASALQSDGKAHVDELKTEFERVRAALQSRAAA